MTTKLPEAVQRQLDEAEALEAQLSAPPPSDEPAPPADPPPAPPEPEPPAPPTEDWEQKYKTLQGKWNAEVPQLRQQVRELTQKVEELTRQPAPTPEPPKAPEPPPKLVTDKDVTAFGEDLVDLIRRAASETYAPERARLQAEIDALRAKLPDLETSVSTMAKTQDENLRERYWAGLSSAVADYAAVNASQEFQDWIVLPDPLSGFVRNDILQDAFRKYDVSRTAAIFNAFKQDTGKSTPPEPDPPAPPPKAELERMVSPGTSKTSSSTSPASSEKKIWTAQEVQDFYTAVTRGDFKGRSKEAEAIDAEIDLAFVEQRVRP